MNRKSPKTMILILILLPLLALSLVPFTAVSQTPEQRGLEIARQADRKDSGWKDQSASIRMVLKNAHGEETVRENRSRTLEIQGDGDKSLIVFDNPADVKGTAFLTHAHALKADDQWLYLPALKRVKRISSSNKSGPFMGSEFAYEDIASQEVEKYDYRYLGEELVEGRDCYRLQRIPRYRNSGYKRQIVWLDKEMLQPMKIEFYDRKDQLLKTLSYFGYRQHKGQFWRSDHMLMVNHVTGKSTDLYWRDYQFSLGLNNRDFDKNSLKRAR